MAPRWQAERMRGSTEKTVQTEESPETTPAVRIAYFWHRVCPDPTFSNAPMSDKLMVIAIIPARMGSSRFPGKPLAPLLGRPMIEHVVRRAMMCDLLDAVYVATCDEEIRDVVEGVGASVIMTSAAHDRASDRVAEAAATLEADIVVMIQGDEPMITTGMIASAVAPMIADPYV